MKGLPDFRLQTQLLNFDEPRKNSEAYTSFLFIKTWSTFTTIAKLESEARDGGYKLLLKIISNPKQISLI